MALQEECTKCRMYKKGTSKMRCSFYASEPKFDDQSCSHFSEKMVQQQVVSESQNESVSDRTYNGPWRTHGGKTTFFEKHEKTIIAIGTAIFVLILVLLKALRHMH